MSRIPALPSIRALLLSVCLLGTGVLSLAASDGEPSAGPALSAAPEAGSWGAGRMRGMNLYGDCTDEDVAALGRWGANHIRLQLTRIEPVQSDGRWTLSAKTWTHIDQIIDQAGRHGMRVVIDMHSNPYFKGEIWKPETQRAWDDPDNRRKLAEIWESIAKRYSDERSVIAGYEILNEPAPPRSPAGYAALSAIMKQVTAAIRRYDGWHTIIVGGPEYSRPGWIGNLDPTGDPNTVYTVHVYEPLEFSHQGIKWASDTPFGQTYPGIIPLGWGEKNKQPTMIDKAWLAKSLEPVVEFQKKHGVRIWIGEFSAIRTCPDNSAFRWLKDATSIFEEHGWDWAYHCFRSDRWDGAKNIFDLDYSSDPSDPKRHATTDRLAVIRGYFDRNLPRRAFPVDFPVSDRGVVGIDLSALNRLPAGQDGFIRMRDGHLASDSGRIRFAGVALVYDFCFPDKADAEAIARHLSRNGINLVRLHFFMAKLMNNSPEVIALHFDRLDFFIAALAKNGIYIDLDLYDLFQVVDREFAEKDSRYKINDFFYHPKCIAAARSYATTLFSHVNPYLGRAYKDEPAIAMTELLNENSFFWHDGFVSASGSAKEEAERLLLEWVEADGIPIEACRPILTDPARGLVRGNITFASVHEQPVMKRFAVHVTQRYYRIMVDHLRALGVRIPITGHNAPFLAADLLPLKNTVDYTCTHFYSPHSNTSSLASPLHDFWLFPAQLARTKVEGMPCIVNEFSYSHPNRFRSEGVPELLAYASLQDVDAIVFFSYLDDWPTEKDAKGAKLANSWRNPAKRLLYHSNFVRDPGIWPLVPAFSAAFRGGHVQPARQEFSYAISSDEAVSMRPRDRTYNEVERTRIDKDRWVFRQMLASSQDAFRQLPTLFRSYEATDVFQLLCWTSRIHWTFIQDGPSRLTHPLARDGFDPGRYAFDYMPGSDDMGAKYQLLRTDAAARGIALPPIEDGAVLASDTGEIRRDFAKGILRVETQQSLALSGFVVGTASVGPLTVSLSNRHASCMLTSLDGLPLDSSRTVLLAFGMNAFNRDQAPAEKDWGIGSPYDLGLPPILCEELQGTVTWKRIGKAQVFREDPDSGSLSEVQVRHDPAGLVIDLVPRTLRYILRFQ